MNSRVSLSKKSTFNSLSYEASSRVQLPPAKFLVEGYQNPHRSPESP